MTNDTYVIRNVRTGEVRPRKTKPKREDVKPEEIVLRSSLEVVTYDEDTEESEDVESVEAEVVEESDSSDDSSDVILGDEDE